MDNILGFRSAIEDAQKATREDGDAYFVYPRLSHNGTTVWAVDNADNLEDIENEQYCHPDSQFLIKIGPRDSISFVLRTQWITKAGGDTAVVVKCHSCGWKSEFAGTDPSFDECPECGSPGLLVEPAELPEAAGI